MGSQLRQAKAQISDDDYKQIEAIISSMTISERRNPHIIDGRRRRQVTPGQWNLARRGLSVTQTVQRNAEDDVPIRLDGQEGPIAEKPAFRFRLAKGNAYDYSNQLEKCEERSDMSAPVTVYMTSTCPWCDRVKDYLNKEISGIQRKGCRQRLRPQWR